MFRAQVLLLWCGGFWLLIFCLGVLCWSRLGWTIQNSCCLDIGRQSDLLTPERPRQYLLVSHPKETMVGGRKQCLSFCKHSVIYFAQSIIWPLIAFLALNCMIHEGQLLFNKDDVYAS